jgi:hypothetical protein
VTATVFEKLFGEKMTAESIGKIMPMVAHPLTLNPSPHDPAFIERQCARIARLRNVDTGEARAEIARCEGKLKISASTLRGRLRVAMARRKF